MANTLSFDVVALDRTAKALESVALRLDKLSAKLDRLDHKRVDVKVDVDTDRASRKLSQFTRKADRDTSFLSKFMTARAGLITAAVAAVLLALPPTAAVAASAVVLAFGAGLVGLGIAAVAHTKPVVKAFTKLKTDVGKTLKSIAEPFIPALTHIAKVAGDVFDSFSGPLKKAFRELAPAISVFADQFGGALKALKPAIGPITDAFTALLRQMGPRMKPTAEAFASTITLVAKVVKDHAADFAELIDVLIRIGLWLVRGVARLAQFYAWIRDNAPKIAAAFIDAWIKVTEYFQGPLTNAILGAFGDILHAAAVAFGWIPGIGGKLRTADKAFDTFRKNVKENLSAAVEKAKEWKAALDKLPRVHKLKGDITDLEGKIRVAKAKLRDPALTKAQKKKIQGDIKDLEAKVAKAKRLLKSIQDENVSIRVSTVGVTAAQNNINRIAAMNRTLSGRASGGPVTAGRPYIVGEKRPELFVPNTSGRIVPEVKTAQTMRGGGTPIVVENHIEIGGEVVRVVRTEIKASDRGKKQRTMARAGNVR